MPEEAISNAEGLLLDNLGLIERTARRVCRRHLFPEDQVEEFVAALKLRLVEDDYRVLREHRGESALSTYLVTVITNAFRDFRTHLWGKWRPSEAAKRRGPVAVRLEQLARDGFSPHEAIELLVCNQEVSETREQLEAISAGLPPRIGRRFVGEQALEQLAVSDGVERSIEARELEPMADRARRLMETALESLPAEDLLILKLHYRDGAKLSEVARHLRLDQRSLYGRRDQTLQRLRRSLEQAGLTWIEVRQILGWEGAELELAFGAEPGKASSSSVQPVGGNAPGDDV